MFGTIVCAREGSLFWRTDPSLVIQQTPNSGSKKNLSKRSKPFGCGFRRLREGGYEMQWSCNCERLSSAANDGKTPDRCRNA